MKNILIIHTGGTIGSFSEKTARVMNGESISETKLLLVKKFAEGKSVYATNSDKLKFSSYPLKYTTLSESMTLEKLSYLIDYIKNVDFENYDGIIVLHGTDTLAFTAALLSFAFSNINIPIIMVSGNRPPADSLSNANANFAAAIELIWGGIAPNVYVAYRNADGVVRLYLGSSIMQSANYSDDFKSACCSKAFNLSNGIADALKGCKALSQNRKEFKAVNVGFGLSQQALLINPYTGLDYSVYQDCLKSGNVKGIVHGSYHSGTVCWGETNSKNSIGFLNEICSQKNIPVFIAPSALGKDQYETMNKVSGGTKAILLNMTTESAYAKLIMALSCNLVPNQIIEYMKTDINNEFN